MRTNALMTLRFGVCMLGVCWSLAASDGTDLKDGLHAADSTVRLRMRTEDGEYYVDGFGAAFGIDLTKFGLLEPRYLLSAAHLVLSKDGPGLAAGDLAIELPYRGRKAWVECKVLAYDKKRDLCLLESVRRLPALSTLKRAGGKVGDYVMIVGCPEGVAPCVSLGRLTDKRPNVKGRLWEAEAEFYHGNSGGPVFDAKAGTVLGVAVAGVSNGQGDMFRDVALFSPYMEVENFLRTVLAE